MSEAIYKHSIRLEDVVGMIEVDLPNEAEVVSVAEQYPGELAFWFRCDPEAKLSRRSFQIVGTGHPFQKGLAYRGTAVCGHGSLILHLMEDTDSKHEVRK